jgi:iron(III) transport system ATP-binding protein
MTEPKTPETLLKAEDVCFSYRGDWSRRLKVLCDISFDIHKGEFLCLLGPSGCGKTTLLRLIAGLEVPDSGSIQSGGHMPKIGMVFQDLALFPHMSAARNIGYALRHLSRPERRTRTDEMLALVGLSDKRGAYPHELSGGQKQRLALARALARQPGLILLDEPFASQDVTLRAQMRDDVMHILREAGVAALLVTHDPEEAMQFADRIAIMNEDGIQQIGVPSEVYNQPNSAFVASFFGQVNTLKGRVSKGFISTPLGSIEASEFQDNTNVQIIIRPEALKLSAHDPAVDHRDPNHTHVHGTVSERKYLGRSTLVHMDTHDLDGAGQKPLHLHARVPGTYSDQGSDVQDIFLDQSQIFVFEDEKAA